MHPICLANRAFGAVQVRKKSINKHEQGLGRGLPLCS